MIEQTMQLSKAEQLRKENRAANRQISRERRRKYIKKHCCQKCGQPKHYICLKHNQYQIRRESFLKKLFRKRRYYARKLYFSIAKGFGFVE
jgi:hypothetical protein